MSDPTFLPERFLAKIEFAPSGCWLWTGARDRAGYGKVKMAQPRRQMYAHRAVYELLVGPIAHGLPLDHVREWGCTQTSCVNPDHLEPVTNQENNCRSGSPSSVNAAKTRCIHGHPFTDANTYRYEGHRFCKVCKIANQRARRGTLVAA